MDKLYGEVMMCMIILFWGSPVIYHVFALYLKISVYCQITYHVFQQLFKKHGKHRACPQ